MRFLPLFVLLSLPTAIYAQAPHIETPHIQQPMPALNQMPPDVSGERLNGMLREADQLQQAGRLDQAAALRRLAEQERQALVRYLDAMKADVERLERLVGHRQQVLVHLKVMEVSLTKIEAMGFDVSKLQGGQAGPSHVKKPNLGVSIFSLHDNSETARLVDAILKDKLVKVISEPTLAMLSGNEAAFRTGGEAPVPTPQANGVVKIEHLFYGTDIRVKPEILADRTVRLWIRGSLSEIDHSADTKVGDTVMPGFRTRDFTTNANILNGQSLLIGGMVQTMIEASQTGLPVVSEIPYAGALFRKTTESRNQIATLVLITPELVEPLDANVAAGDRGQPSPRRIATGASAGPAVRIRR